MLRKFSVSIMLLAANLASRAADIDITKTGAVEMAEH